MKNPTSNALVFVVFLSTSSFSTAHPGSTDKNGCHVCRTNCAKYGLKDGELHCQPAGGQAAPASQKAPASQAVPASQRAYVEKVSDGDTVKVRLLPSAERVTVRVLGMDCPESHINAKCKRDGEAGRKDCDWQVPRGKKAAQQAAEWLKQQTVVLECGNKCEKDRYGRLLRYIRIANGKDFGLEMIRAGLCEDFGWKYPHPRGREYKEAEKLSMD